VGGNYRVIKPRCTSDIMPTTHIVEVLKMPTHPLSALHVTGVRYRGSRPARGDERALDAYLASAVYQHAQVPVDISEPVWPEHLRSDEETDNLGLIGAAIA